MSEPSSGVAAPADRGRLARAAVAITATFSLLIGVGTAYSLVAYKQAGDVGANEGFLPPSAEGDAAATSDDPCSRDVCNYLLLGSDSRAGLTAEERDQFGTDQEIGGENRADTIMLVHTDPGLEKAIILSFPRDLWVRIPGQGWNKINASFEGGLDGGGPRLVARTVQKLTGLPIDHVLYVDLAGFQGLVETLGGVDMCIPGENVNTPGQVEAPGGGTVYYEDRGYIADPFTGLLVKPGCSTLPADQALAYVRTRHLRCDGAAPDFYRITRQQQFLRAVINRLLQPDQLAKLPFQIKPILRNLERDDELKIADLAYLVGQLEGISTGAAEFRTVPGIAATIDGLAVIRLDPAANRMFKAVADGRQLGPTGTAVYTPPSEATIPVLVVDHASGGGVSGVQDVLSQAGFDISPGTTAYSAYPKKVPGSLIAYAPDADAEAQVVKKYFPTLELKQVKGLPDGVAVFIDGAYEPAQVGGETGAPPECPTPEV
ncbi:MAG: LCP family protein [Actinomycetota bacterium]|nr:LCP family protein [Actinomycetota bacterium]MDH5313373.1 LCP family protein [Actinomycetota bacterium]